MGNDSTMIRIAFEPFHPARETEAYSATAENAGAVVSFLGKVRGDVDGSINGLLLEHYPGLTEQSMTAISERACARWDITEPLIIHRVGALALNEPIVLVCVAACHRREAFVAADFIMDYLKTEALFWKKELRHSGDAWIEPRSNDYDDAKRWREEG